MKADIGFIGLAVMGENLALNMERNGVTVAVFNKTTSVMDTFLGGRGRDKRFIRCETLPELVSAVKRPRNIMMMIKAGNPVDMVIEQLVPLLEAGDTIIDGGNSNFNDTTRRTRSLEERGLRFIGTGISGGEEGALNGPSMMPGGTAAAWTGIRPLFETIAAKAPDGTPCCAWIGSGGAGHYVKMVHNGIEYGDMQIVSEIYWIMKELFGLDYRRMSAIFREWNTGKLESYLVGITADILAFKDKDGSPILERILDSAGQKGTGKWTGMAALEEGSPLTLIVESVFARSLSAMKAQREAASGLFPVARLRLSQDPEGSIEALRDALYAAKMVSYAQGFELLQRASQTNGWELNLASVARIWRGGCIIRSVFLDRIAEAYDRDRGIANLVLSPYFRDELRSCEQSWRKIVLLATENALPVPALSSALSWFDGFRSARLPANLIQAQRDYFGAHTYERTDSPRGEFFHTDWTGHGGNVTSHTYNA